MINITAVDYKLVTKPIQVHRYTIEPCHLWS